MTFWHHLLKNFNSYLRFALTSLFLIMWYLMLINQCLIINSKHDLIGHPLFHLSGAPLPYTDSYKYLGQLINSGLSDDADIMKQTRSLYARSNMILRKFTPASLITKIMLFNAYCTLIMAVRSGVRCISTPIVNWMLHIMMPLDTCCINLARWCSASQRFVANNVFICCQYS